MAKKKICSKCGSDYADNYYKDKVTEEILCEDCLLEIDKVTSSTITNYYIDGEYIGNDECDIEEILKTICDYFDYEEVKE